jgi:ABC-2 type transport system permease protein
MTERLREAVNHVRAALRELASERGGVTGLLGAVRLQAALVRRTPGDLLALVTAPFYTLAFLAITRHAGRGDLTGYAVLGPAVVAILGMAILASGEIVAADRSAGTLELALATPTPLPVAVFGRIGLVTVVSLVAVGESWLVAWLAFGVRVPVAHPMWFAVTLLAVALGTAGLATAMSAVFVLARSARTFQNSLSFPLFLLGGAMVPVSFLPGWLQPVSRLLYLSWATDLLRDTLTGRRLPGATVRFGIVVALGLAGTMAGSLLLNRLVDKARATGTVGYE